MKEKIKSAGWFALAFVTCPCHLVFILPLIATTALGAFLATNILVVRIIMAIVFGTCLFFGISRIIDLIDKKRLEKKHPG